MIDGDGIARTAILSPDGRYRYRLTRWWESGYHRRCVFVMLNPSTADANIDDPTIRRCMSFARREGYGGIEVVNLFAMRTTRPVHLKEAADPVGPENNSYLRSALIGHSMVIAAWGAHKMAAIPGRALAAMANGAPPLHCLGTTKDGSPRHPLYLKETTPLQRWEPKP